MKKLDTCSLFGAASAIGQDKEGVDITPEWLRHNNLYALLEKKFNHIEDLGNFYPHDFKHFTHSYLELLSRYSKHLSENIYEHLDDNRFALTIGGDHSIALSTLAACIEKDPNIKVIWVDAHADINTYATSPTKHTHGMPVAWALGIMGEEQEHFHWMKKLKPENIIYLGLRDIDEGEIKILDDLNIKYFTADKIKEIGMGKALELSNEYLESTEGDNLHISFDVDGVDPEFFPATGTPVSGGISLEDGKNIIKNFFEKFNVLALDLVEVNPALGSKEEVERTLSSTMDLLNAIPETDYKVRKEDYRIELPNLEQ